MQVWADRKYLAKKASAEARHSASATGGGPASAPLISGVDAQICAIMGEGFGMPATNAYINAFPQVGLYLLILLNLDRSHTVPLTLHAQCEISHTIMCHT